MSYSRFSPAQSTFQPIRTSEHARYYAISLSGHLAGRKGLRRLKRILAAFPGDKRVRLDIDGHASPQLREVRVEPCPDLERELRQMARG